MAEPDYRSDRPLSYSGPATEDAIAMHRAARTVKDTGGSVEIGGVKITPVDPDPETVHAITSVKLTPTGHGAQQLLITDDSGRVMDFSSVVFSDGGIQVREVGVDPDFAEYGLNVTLVLSPGSDTHVVPPPPPPAIRATRRSDEQVAAEVVGDMPPVEPVDPAEEPDLRERFVRTVGRTRDVWGFTDDDDGNEKSEATIPMPVLRKLLLDAGFERDYVRDDVEVELLDEEVAAEHSGATTPKAGWFNEAADALQPNAQSLDWDTMTVSDAWTLAARRAGGDDSATPQPWRSPTTPRGHLLLQMWSRLIYRDLYRRGEVGQPSGNVDDEVRALRRAVIVLDDAAAR